MAPTAALLSAGPLRWQLGVEHSQAVRWLATRLRAAGRTSEAGVDRLTVEGAPALGGYRSSDETEARRNSRKQQENEVSSPKCARHRVLCCAIAGCQPTLSNLLGGLRAHRGPTVLHSSAGFHPEHTARPVPHQRVRVDASNTRARRQGAGQRLPAPSCRRSCRGSAVAEAATCVTC